MVHKVPNVPPVVRSGVYTVHTGTYHTLSTAYSTHTIPKVVHTAVNTPIHDTHRSVQSTHQLMHQTLSGTHNRVHNTHSTHKNTQNTEWCTQQWTHSSCRMLSVEKSAVTISVLWLSYSFARSDCMHTRFFHTRCSRSYCYGTSALVPFSPVPRSAPSILLQIWWRTRRGIIAILPNGYGECHLLLHSLDTKY